MAKSDPLFSSFVLGGFECAHVLIREPRRRLDMLRDTHHDTDCFNDYLLLRDVGITTVREGFAWHEIDRGGGSYNFGRFVPMMEAAQNLGIEQIWDLTHFDVPEDIDAFAPDIIPRFVDYSLACLAKIREYISGVIYLVPVNEMSFFAYMGGTVGIWAPFGIEQGMQWKKQLVKMSIAAIDAIRKADSNVRFIQVEPHMYRKPKYESIVTRATADMFHEIRYQPFDMLTGKLLPELGGDDRYLDIIGLNYYPSSQEFIVGEDDHDTSSFETIDFHTQAWRPLSSLIKEVYDRYGRPMLVSETGAWGNLRPDWWQMLFTEVEKVRSMGIPLEGVCAYPVIDRPDWNDGHLTNSGFWDFENNDPTCRRIPHQETLNIIRKYVRLNQEGSVR